MDMRSYIARKSVYLNITLFAILSFNFFLFRIMPGDPARAFLPKTANKYLIELARQKFDLDHPLHIQFIHYIEKTLTGDFGIRITYQKNVPITDLLGPPILNTVLLLGIGTVLAIWFGVMLGRAAAWRRGKVADTVGMAFALGAAALPVQNVP